MVVSPLVALMMDQLRKLPSVIPGGLLSSTQVADPWTLNYPTNFESLFFFFLDLLFFLQTIHEASETLRRLREGTIKVIVCCLYPFRRNLSLFSYILCKKSHDPLFLIKN